MKYTAKQRAWKESIFATDKFSSDLRRSNTVRGIFNVGYDAGQRPDWILTADRMPTEEGPYLGTGDDGKIKLAYLQDGKLTPCLNSHGVIVAWMPLPEPYK